MPKEMEMRIPKHLVRYVVEDVDRHGNVRIYFRRKGQPKIRLPGPIGSADYLAAYKVALEGAPVGGTAAGASKIVAAGSIRWLCVEYFKSAGFQGLAPRTQYVRRGILERFCQHKGDGEKPYAMLLARHIRVRRDELADRPEAANGLVKALRQVFKFATEYDLHDRNPARDVDYFTASGDGFHSWTEVELAQFEECHPIGTLARLAFALALYTAQRRADIVQFGKQHMRDGWLTFTQHKGRNRKPVHLEIPIVTELQRIIDASATGDLTFLINGLGRPFTSNGFGNWFRDRCDEAGLPQCSMHGLRKAAATRLANCGCTPHEIMAITGHTTLKEVTRYTKAANQKKQASSAMKRLMGEQT